MDASSQMEQIAGARWQAHSIDRFCRLLGLLGLGAAVVLALSYAARYADELLNEVGDAGG